MRRKKRQKKEWFNYQRMGYSRLVRVRPPRFDAPFFGDGPPHTGVDAQSYDDTSQPWIAGSGRQTPDLNRANLILSCWNTNIEKTRQRY